MSDWSIGTIGDLAKGHRGVSYSAGQLCEFKSSQTVTLLRSNNISSGRLNFNDIQIVPARLVSESQFLRNGDIAVCMSNGSKALVGKAAPFPASGQEQFTIGAFCSVFRPQQDAHPSFVGHIFQSSSYRRNLDFALAGTAINNLRNPDLELFRCEIPPLTEQRAIAEILDTLDIAIHETEMIIAKLKAVKQGLLHDLLTRGIDANGELRPPQSEAPHLYKESPLGWIPKEWEQTNFGTRVGLLGGYGFPERFQNHTEGEIPFFKVSDQSSFGNERDLRVANHYVSRDRARKQGWRLLPKDGVAFAKVGAALLLNRRRFLAQDSLVDNNMMVAIAINSLSSRWLYWFLQTVDFGLFVQPGALPSINQGQLSDQSVAFPDVKEQDAIAARLDQIDIKAESEQGMLRKLVELKAGLMDDLLTGQVRVTPLLAAEQEGSA